LVASAVVALVGVVLTGIGAMRLRGWRRSSTGRHDIPATVIAAGQGNLLLRLHTEQAREIDVIVPPRLAEDWRKRLAQGPPPVEEPDYEDPYQWDEVLVSYAPNGNPEALLSEQHELARQGPLVQYSVGLLLIVFGVVALYSRILLVALGVISGLLAILFTRAAWRGGQRAVLALTAVFLACTAAACVFGALQ
jgi:hypothetical protein